MKTKKKHEDNASAEAAQFSTLQFESSRRDDNQSHGGEQDIKGSRAEETDAKDAVIRREDIAKEIQKVQWQNRVTHWLLSALIFLTVAQQVSEISFIMRIKNGFSNPFKFVSDALSKKPNIPNLPPIEAPSPPSIQIPHLPRLDFPALGFNGEDF